MPLSRAILHERLLAVIRAFGSRAAEHRQVARRLRALLPERLKSLHRAHRGAADSESSSARAERHTLIDPTWLAHVEEVVAMSHSATLARIEYETHMMLFEARRSLRRAGASPRKK